MLNVCSNLDLDLKNLLNPTNLLANIGNFGCSLSKADFLGFVAKLICFFFIFWVPLSGLDRLLSNWL